ncbi:hypothetical protein DRW07_10705 [Alteromonas sediminis]|uniref:Uncharacterized protein n=1 Tax=Alteromonas sediminis TaxID=2259342 RepID=A0A3N5XZ49_9ALTE|nr:hypothetical protein [Alteromonas sediminis]RPJ66547.1 hypothetical protein DRW07_10705 [Alteromonas sediminis]
MNIDLNDGEWPIQHAPLIPLEEGGYCIPQHYLRYTHSKSTIEKIVAECSFDDHFLFFVGEDAGSLYLQVGIVGYDTYKREAKLGNKKIVYGRKWRVDLHTSTSEVIQTLFLAVKKAREHEVRELLKLQFREKWSAPFSTHQDLPLIAKYADHLYHSCTPLSINGFRRQAAELFKNLIYDEAALSLINIEQRNNGQVLVDVKLEHNDNSTLVLHGQQEFTLLLPATCTNALLHALMENLVAASNAYVAERFRFRGVNRFSHSISVTQLASLSIQTRAHQNIPGLKQNLKKLNAEVDQLRVPQVTGQQVHSVVEKLTELGQLDGFYPALEAENE